MDRLKIKSKGYATFFGVLSAISLSLCFILGPLGSYVIWIFGGLTLFSVFMAIFKLIPQPKIRNTRRRLTRQEEENRAYIAFHLPLVISLLLAGLLVALIVVFFAT